MNSISFSALALAGTVSAACAGEVKPAPPASASASASVSAVPQPSALEGYRRYEQAPAIGWRQANEEAAALGGHVGQIRGKPPAPAQEPEASREGARGARR